MTQNRLVGTWKLISPEIRDAEGNVSYPYGPDAIGYLTYTENGYMSAVIMAANRPKLADNIQELSTEEKASAAETYISYCGKYEIQANKVIHHVDACLYPNWVGTKQERFFEFKGEQLLLTSTQQMSNGQKLTSYILWEPVGPA